MVVQVKRLAQAGSLLPKTVKIPGILVDYLVVDPEQRQTYATDYDPTYAGELRGSRATVRPLPFGPRKIVARQAAMELTTGAICNLGAGISTGISAVAAEEGILDRMTLTNEQGFIGGAPLTGPDSGAAQNYDALVDQPYQFDFYDGGGLDIAFLSFGEVDTDGNVNVSRFGDKIIGIGGFINISQSAKKVVFSGTFTAGGLDVDCVNGALRINKEGRHAKFAKDIEQICYNAGFAMREGRGALFVTERAGLRAVDGALEIIEIARPVGRPPQYRLPQRPLTCLTRPRSSGRMERPAQPADRLRRSAAHKAAAGAIPVLLVAGSRDMLVEPDWTDKLSALFSRCAVKVLDAKHAPNVDRPGQVSSLLMEWLGQS